jgi:hypothetical protein
MNAKEAVSAAKASIGDLFGDQIVSDPLLEEIELDDQKNVWRVTIGFLRMPELLRSPTPAERAATAPGADSPVEQANPALGIGAFRTPRRTYKVVSIDGGTKQVLSVRDRELQ